MEDTKISPNVLSFIGLANEYCVAVTNAHQSEKEEFIAEMLRLLPRIYIAISDVSIVETDYPDDDGMAIGNYIEEEYYENVRRHLEMLFGEDDTFLETFEEDMKYSDTPIGVSVSEYLADIFQDLFNFVAVVRDSEGLHTMAALIECKENFEAYWSQKLCNVLRAINKLRYT